MMNRRPLERFLLAVCMVAALSGCPIFVGLSPEVGQGWRLREGVLALGRDVKIGSDGSYFISGEAQFSKNGGIHAFAAIVGPSGEMTWRSDTSAPLSPFYSAGNSYAVLAQDGSIYIAGTNKALGVNRTDALLKIQRIDPLRNTSWNNTFGPSVLIPGHVFLDVHGQLRLAGAQSNGVFSEAGFAATIPPDGSQIVTTFLEGPATGFAAGLTMRDGNSALIGGTGVEETSNINLVLWVLDSTGGTVRTVVYPDDRGSDFPTSICQSLSGDFFVVGEKGISAALWHIASDGTFLNFVYFLGEADGAVRESHDAWDIAVNLDGTLIVVGLQQFTTVGPNGLFLQEDNRNFVIKLDAEGNIIWRKDISGVALYGCDVGPDGTIAVTGSAGDALALILLDQNGTIIN